jgi:hypothetical protein
VATYHPVSSIWPFFFSQVATYHPVADYNIQKYLSKINMGAGFSYKKHT